MYVCMYFLTTPTPNPCTHTLQVAAERIGSSVTGMLAVQVAGATIGNMICINNILSAKAVMNMAHVPGARVRVCGGPLREPRSLLTAGCMR
jgi:hypothetical protein